jgi:protein TonB
VREQAVRKGMVVAECPLNSKPFAFMSRRSSSCFPSLPWAVLASVVLHGLLLIPQSFWPLFQLPPTRLQPPARLEARLSPLPVAEAAPLLKNTLLAAAVAAPAAASVAPAASAVSKAASTVASPPRAARKARGEHGVQIAQRKLAQHMYYPPEAIAQGLEGEVRLLLRLAEDGRLLAVSVAASSGFPLLDRAALEAAHAMGRIPEAGVRELLLPVVFRLQ